jgi:hypothetical protein
VSLEFVSVCVSNLAKDREFFNFIKGSRMKDFSGLNQRPSKRPVNLIPFEQGPNLAGRTDIWSNETSASRGLVSLKAIRGLIRFNIRKGDESWGLVTWTRLLGPRRWPVVIPCCARRRKHGFRSGSQSCYPGGTSAMPPHGNGPFLLV